MRKFNSQWNACLHERKESVISRTITSKTIRQNTWFQSLRRTLEISMMLQKPLMSMARDQKTFNGDGFLKNIEIYNGLCKIIDISNVLRKLWNHVIYRIVFDVMVLLITLYFLSCKHAFHCKLNSRTFYCIGFSKPFSSKIWKLSKNHWGQCTVSPKIVLPSFSSKAGSLLQYQCKWK